MGTDQALSEARSEKSGWYLDLTPLGNMGQLAVGYDSGKIRYEGGVYVVTETGSINGVSYTAFITSFMGNIYADLGSPDSRWSPYVGAGLGYGTFGITDGNITITSDSGGLSFRVSGGLSYAFAKSWDANILIGYHGLSIDGIEELGQFGGALGLRYRF